MTDITVIEDTDHKPAPPKRRGGRPASKRRQTRTPRAPEAKASPLAGLTALDCAAGCTPARCVISGVGCCAHPAKGGLQATLQNEKTLRMYNQAKTMIAGLKLKLGGE